MHISNPEVRATLVRTLRRLNALYRTSFQKQFWLKDLRRATTLIEGLLREAKRGNRTYLSDEFDLATCAVVTVGMLALSVHRKRYSAELLPTDWLSSSRRPNPNHVLQGLLLQLTNFSLSAVLLLQSGLDNPGRALLRSAVELAHQTLVLMANREDMRLYITGHEEESSNRAWFTLFGRGSLNRKLHQLESLIGLDAELAEHMKTSRRENEQFYSQAVHHSYIATAVGAYAESFDRPGQSALGIFAAENRSIATPLRHLNTTLWYFLLMFFAILDRIHHVRPRHWKKGMWLEAFMLHFCVRELYLSVYVQRVAPVGR